MSDLQSTVDGLQRRVKSASTKVATLKGKHEAAKQAKADVEDECKRKKIDPDRIDSVRTQLEKKFADESSVLEEKIQQVETSLEAYQEA